MNSHRKGILLSATGFVLSIMILLASSCEPSAPIRIRNETSETLKVFVNGTFAGTVAPHAEIKNTAVGIIFDYTIEVKNTQEKVIYSEKFTHDEMKWVGWRILIPSSRSP